MLLNLCVGASAKSPDRKCTKKLRDSFKRPLSRGQPGSRTSAVRRDPIQDESSNRGVRSPRTSPQHRSAGFQVCLLTAAGYLGLQPRVLARQVAKRRRHLGPWIGSGVHTGAEPVTQLADAALSLRGSMNHILSAIRARTSSVTYAGDAGSESQRGGGAAQLPDASPEYDLSLANNTDPARSQRDKDKLRHCIPTEDLTGQTAAQ